MIRTVEELSMNAWPALQTLCYDGWVLRFARGYTRRANSVMPLYPSGIDTADKIRNCEKVYRSKSLVPTFKVTPDSEPPALDALLEAQGYERDALTSVQLMDLRRLDETPPPAARVDESASAAWQAAFSRMNKMAPAHQGTHQQLLDAILPAKRFAAVEVDGQIVACGLGVAEHGYVGLFDIVVDAGQRRQGYGEQVVRGLLLWGKQEGAHSAYLQVMLNNAPALRLYAKLGFREIYQYWYRLKR